MSTYKIVFLDSITIGEASLDSIRQLGEFTEYKTTTPEQTISRIENADIVISNKVKIFKAEIDAAKKLKLICVAATGTNNIDTAYAASKGIPVKNVCAYSTESVVQTTFMHILSLVGHSKFYDNYVKSGQYEQSHIFTCPTSQFMKLAGKTMGIIGLGTIGERVAQVASAFGMNVIYYSTQGKAHNSKYRMMPLNELLATADVVTIHCPLNEHTNALIGFKELQLMKAHAILVNVARGGIVVEQNLADAIDRGIIAGAAVDVFTSEPIGQNHPYLKMSNKENIILSPHIAWNSYEDVDALIMGIAENIRRFLLSLQPHS